MSNQKIKWLTAEHALLKGHGTSRLQEMQEMSPKEVTSAYFTLLTLQKCHELNEPSQQRISRTAPHNRQHQKCGSIKIRLSCDYERRITIIESVT